MKKVIIAGSRSITNGWWVRRRLDEILHLQEVEVVSGLAAGPDTFGKRWAEDRGLPVKEFPANWRRFGRRAGMLRNREMADYADEAIVFWDGVSRGSLNMIEEMKKRGKAVRVESRE